MIMRKKEVNNYTINSSGHIFKTHPLSYIIPYDDLMWDTEELEVYWCTNGNPHKIALGERRYIPVVILQLACVGGITRAEILKKSDYNNEVFELT